MLGALGAGWTGATFVGRSRGVRLEMLTPEGTHDGIHIAGQEGTPLFTVTCKRSRCLPVSTKLPARSHTSDAQMRERSTTIATVWRPRLLVSAIRGNPTERAVILYHTGDPALVRLRLARRSSYCHPACPRPDGSGRRPSWLRPIDR
jgi:hypothetical protein